MKVLRRLYKSVGAGEEKCFSTLDDCDSLLSTMVCTDGQVGSIVAIGFERICSAANAAERASFATSSVGDQHSVGRYDQIYRGDPLTGTDNGARALVLLRATISAV